MVRRHNKSNHNGKNRHTGRKIPKRSEHDKKVKTRSIGSGKGFDPIKPPRRPTRNRCNCSGDVMDKVNERLFNAWSKIPRDENWNVLTGEWEIRVYIPRYFAIAHEPHMHHFRPYLRERVNALNRQKPHTRR
jgi:hypothetical protein